MKFLLRMITYCVWLLDDVVFCRRLITSVQCKKKCTIRMNVTTFFVCLCPGHIAESTTDFTTRTLFNYTIYSIPFIGIANNRQPT